MKRYNVYKYIDNTLPATLNNIEVVQSFDSLLDAYKFINSNIKVIDFYTYLNDKINNIKYINIFNAFVRDELSRLNKLLTLVKNQLQENDLEKIYIISFIDNKYESYPAVDNDIQLMCFNEALKLEESSLYIMKNPEITIMQLDRYFRNNVDEFLAIVDLLIEHNLYTTYKWRRHLLSEYITLNTISNFSSINTSTNTETSTDTNTDANTSTETSVDTNTGINTDIETSTDININTDTDTDTETDVYASGINNSRIEKAGYKINNILSKYKLRNNFFTALKKKQGKLVRNLAALSYDEDDLSNFNISIGVEDGDGIGIVEEDNNDNSGVNIFPENPPSDSSDDTGTNTGAETGTGTETGDDTGDNTETETGTKTETGTGTGTETDYTKLVLAEDFNINNIYRKLEAGVLYSADEFYVLNLFMEDMRTIITIIIDNREKISRYKVLSSYLKKLLQAV